VWLLFPKHSRGPGSANPPDVVPDIPEPGRPVRGSSTGRPIMALLDLLGRRWALRVLWELRADVLTFRQLQARCEGMSSSVLNQRLRELRAAGIVMLRDRVGYQLTPEGQALLAALTPLHDWAVRWSERSQYGSGP
jgi:DNA-binding HxlR family transcriptional regulator